MPPADNFTPDVELCVSEAADVCQGEEFVRHSVVKVCVMFANDFSDERCENVAVDGSNFCADHQGVKLCKTSGIQYRRDGNSGGFFIWMKTIPAHPIDAWGRTERADFCCDRCRNLWRDTKTSRERAVEIAKLVNGGRSERYGIIKNYRNSGQTVILDKQTSRIVDHID